MVFGIKSDLVEEVEARRRAVTAQIDPQRRVQLGQFLTPLPVARLMASMFGDSPDHVRLLDAGAGVGSLTAATVAELAARAIRPSTISATAYEIDESLIDQLRLTMESCADTCGDQGIEFTFKIISGDFIKAMVQRPTDRFTAAIINPPYFKVAARSDIRQHLRSLGVEVPNIYAAFVAGTLSCLEPLGEVVAITPRSFCNGTYFRSFRHHLLEQGSIRRLHVFESRSEAFKDTEVLQENVIFHMVKSPAVSGVVTLTTSMDIDGTPARSCTVPFEQVVDPDDPERFIHIDPDEAGHSAAAAIQALPACLTDLGVWVSTGPVVDFRAREYLRAMPDDDCAPLIYPTHMVAHAIHWPKPNARKPNAIIAHSLTAKLLVPDGNYVLVKRFSAKEERRRVVAAVFEGGTLDSERIGLENHLNYFHQGGRGLPLDLARGLSLYLNSSAVDAYFRRFSGHTQVNATDLRNIRYPARAELIRVGAEVIPDDFASQSRIDKAAEIYFSSR